ncbi:hypothetical protein HK105_203658 [Polyrhizophydium stewartii]|uniref:Uncharacterized protein n=1 Tax=Polyrhizophydium stewartii TaxID=2732419 RepID=A0ABR4NBR4_9FUNG|nr:hypothetical protein HK105_008173 [Polyrhizophydium stewartii]
MDGSTADGGSLAQDAQRRRFEFSFATGAEHGGPLRIVLAADTAAGAAAFRVQDQGRYLWPGAEPLAAHLARSFPVRGMALLELGAGVGLAACVAAAQRARRIVATDFDERTLELLRENMAANMAAHDDAEQTECVAAMLDWNTVVDPARRALSAADRRAALAAGLGIRDGDPSGALFDSIIGSDLIWDEESASLLTAAAAELLRICRGPDQIPFVLAFVERSEYLRLFFEEQAKAHGLEIAVVQEHRSKPVQVTPKRWTKPQATFVLRITLAQQAAP